MRFYTVISLLVVLISPLAARDFRPAGLPYTISLPDRWNQIETSQIEAIPASVKLLVRGEGEYELPPTVNIAVEQVAPTLSTGDYLKSVQALHSANLMNRCWQLGPLTGGGEPLELVQVQMESSWGPVELLQAILVRDGQACVITASARQEEFGQQLPIFIQAMQSFKVVK